MSTNKPLIDIIDEMLNESIADDINKITADNVKDGANLKPMGDHSSADTQGVEGKTSGAALDAGGDKDVGPSGKKGHFPSQASPDTQGVLGKDGQALDAGGDTDVGGPKGNNPSDASPDTQGILGKTSGAALDAGGDKDVGKLKEDTEEEWSFIDEETGEELSEEEIEEFAEWVSDNFELDEDLEEMMIGSKAGTKQSKAHIMKKAVSRQAGSGPDGNKKISLAGPGGKKITATKTNSTEPGKRFSVGEDYSDIEFTDEDIQQLVDEGFDLDEIMEFFETEELDEISMDLAKKTAKARDDKGYGMRSKASSFAFQGDAAEKHAANLMKDAGKHWAKADKTKAIIKKREGQNEELEMRIEAMCNSKKKMKEETVAEAEQPESVGGKSYEDANKQYRPEQEKDVNPQNKGGDPMGSKTGAALDAGGDKDAAPAGKKGEYPSEASADTQGVLGKTKGAALDAGGDKDVGKLKEDEDFDISEYSLEEIDEYMMSEEFEALDEISKEALGNYRRSAKINRRQNDEIIGSQMASNDQVKKAKADNVKRTKGIDKAAKKLAEKLHGDQHKLDHNDNGKIDGGDMKDVRKKGATAHLNKEEVSEEALIDEDFKAKAEVIFEAAVGEKVNIIKEEMKLQYDAYLQEEINDLNEKVTQFVEEAVEEWLKENALEVRYSLRTEVAENFITGLKGLFEESYIEIPEEEYSVVDELTESVEDQKEQIDSLTEELKEAKMFILEAKKQDVLKTLSEDLTQTQAVRLEKLAEGLEAKDVKEFEEKVAQLKEGYFDPSSEQPLMSLTEEVFTGTEELIEDNDSSVSQYAKFLSKTVLK